MTTPFPTTFDIGNLENRTAAICHPPVSVNYGNAGNLGNVIPAGTGDHLLAAEMMGRQGWFIKAPRSNTGSLWVGIGRGPLVGRDIEVAPGEPFVCPINLVSSDELRIRGTVGDRFFFMQG